MFGGVISNLAHLPLEPTIAVIQRLYHTLLTRMTQNPGGGALIHLTASYAAWCKLCKKTVIKTLPRDIIYHRPVSVEKGQRV